MLYQGSAKPLYHQLKEVIVQKIENGEYPFGHRLPGERQLAEIYNVSRITIRQAISELVTEGFLIRQHGKGTFVANRKIVHNLGRLTGVVEDLALQNYKVDTTVLSQKFEKASPDIQKHICLENETIVFGITRLLRTNNSPLAINYSYVSENIGYLVNTFNLEHDILFEMLERNGYKISHAEQYIGADKVSAAEAKLLDYKAGAPVLVVKQIIYVESGQPIMFAKNVFRPDKYEYQIDLKRNLPSSLS